MIVEEYRRSLKMPEAEELLDLLFYRPVAFLFVKVIYRLPITPNQVTLLSLLAGLLSGWCFASAPHGALSWAAIWYLAANILDCSDGQLARLQSSGSLLGRVIDGVADYASSIAIFIGLWVGGSHPLALVIAAGVSSALHAFFFDHYQSEFISTVRAERNFLEREVDTFTLEIARLRREGGSALSIVTLELYLRYLAFQKRSNTKAESQSFEPESYRKSNLLMIRLWSFLGPTTNRSLLIACAFAGRVDLFLWTVVMAGNAWLAVCFFLQRGIHRRLSR
jgi:phosphatidylglycerophosphate synthase